MVQNKEIFSEISPADFFYRNRDIAGFSNPSRAIYSAIREFVENSLDTCELNSIPPNVYIKVSYVSGNMEGPATYKIRIEDNGGGVPPEHIPMAFGRVFYGSKYKLRQTRGTFGLGGTMAILYGQITTHKPVYIISSTGADKIFESELIIDIQRNEPVVLKRRTKRNKVLRWRVVREKLPFIATRITGSEECTTIVDSTKIPGGEQGMAIVDYLTDPENEIATVGGVTDEELVNGTKLKLASVREVLHKLRRRSLVSCERWHGTVLELQIEGDYFRAMPKILDYFKQTAMVSPYADIVFVDPRNRLYMFQRNTTKMPSAAKEVKPHPYGVDVETIQRIMRATDSKSMASFMTTHFHRVGEKTAQKFLKEAEIDPDLDPKKLAPHDVVNLVHHLKSFREFLPPDASCLSPLGEELLEKGVRKELNPEFVAVDQRNPAAYSGFSFIVETAITYGGEVQRPGIELYRFANRIRLLYDEASDVSWKVINTLINWRHYKIAPEVPIAIVVHLCSTKIPYKSVGKEFIADRPEVEREILNSVRELARKLSLFISRKANVEREKEKIDLFTKYMPKIAHFSAKLAGKSKDADIEPLLKNIGKLDTED